MSSIKIFVISFKEISLIFVILYYLLIILVLKNRKYLIILLMIIIIHRNINLLNNNDIVTYIDQTTPNMIRDNIAKNLIIAEI